MLGSHGLTDDPETWRGAPVGLHLVGRSYEEEAVIAMTEIVAEALKKAGVHQRSNI